MPQKNEAHRKIAAAQALLLEPLTSRQAFSQIRTLIQGVNPAIDQHLSSLDRHLSTWDKMVDGDVVSLSAERLPENTEEEKGRKKWLLLFISTWKQLGTEVERVRVEMSVAEKGGSSDKVSHWGRVFRHAKGPLGFVTVLAVGVVVMQQTAVDITIKNNGCQTLYPANSIPITIPGLKLPSEPLESGGSSSITLPGVSLHVDGTSKGVLSMKLLTYSISIQLPSNVKNVTLNGASLLGKATEVKLSEHDAHVVELTCS